MSNHRVKDAADSPADVHLPGLRDLLTPERLAALLSERIASVGVIESLTLDYVRYTPATSCVAAFTASVRIGETPQGR